MMGVHLLLSKIKKSKKEMVKKYEKEGSPETFFLTT
jgi:hypothetical protein